MSALATALGLAASGIATVLGVVPTNPATETTPEPTETTAAPATDADTDAAPGTGYKKKVAGPMGGMAKTNEIKGSITYDGESTMSGIETMLPVSMLKTSLDVLLAIRLYDLRIL
ncbi:hypothetical protein BC828DRAFT_405177 [Blastocladiella britannica]|nr:hypothetical protein BC828DRAFT_405177 [Blastocladiella britannica]